MGTNIGFPEAIRKVAPRSAGGTHQNRIRNLSFSATTTTAETDTGWAGDAGGCWMTYRTSADCLIAFGETGLVAATANDADVKSAEGWQEIWIEKNTRYFRVFGGAADGTFKWWISS